jgi:hypothetical protein
VDYLAELAANIQLSRLKMEWMIGMDGKCLDKIGDKVQLVGDDLFD